VSAGKKARKRARQAADYGKLLRSGMTGNGGRTAANNGHPDIATTATSPHEGKQVPYRVIGTTESSYSTDTAGNSTMIWREEK
jgi:hypothetical protein